MSKGRDYLFSDFYDPYINLTEAIPTFFLYVHVFQKEILGLATNRNTSQIELRFHRPSLEVAIVLLSTVIMWLLAVGCIVGGALWAFFRHKAGKDTLAVNAANADVNNAINILPIVLLVFFVAIMVIAYFFRDILAFILNVWMIIVGWSCLYTCTTAVLSYVPLGGWLQSAIHFTICMLSLGVNIIRFIYRRSPYAFILTDVINVTLCLDVATSFRLPNVQCITVVMIFMFVYDVLMVFGTPFFMTRGCSLMDELVSGIPCSSENTEPYPVAPIDTPIPEPFPFIMQVPFVDPMVSCVDLDVEKGFKLSILGLGDIIIPGILVTHCCVMNGFSEYNRIFYGVLCSIGYGIGLILTYIALFLMKRSQPALIYLVPCTLIPVCLTAYVRGHLRLLWYGLEEPSVTTARPN
ncbi:Signal peptide peptidase [Trichostrongylus colubriformis]|uniref:Signal peptide peptidase n=1 Tax=Trichostrongylus colubriformis TaxID=6319 RepID=A0AAN8EZX9_TRICO